MDFLLPVEAMEELAGPLSAEQADRLTQYGCAILEASRRVNLVSRQSLADIGEHFVDSASLLSFVEPGACGLADLGSGAGFPGLVVAILRPATRVTLIDSRRSKVVFLKDLKRRLGLENVTVVHARLEELQGEADFELATARALGSVEDVLAPCLRLLVPGGRLVLFKGPQWPAEATRAAAVAASEGAEITRTETVALPGLDRATRFVEFHVKQPEHQ
ncbi:MAG TPA: 16S rRNA (guanine(527)-N(7))-methyltransferase RsmG [bacterium]|nr:16S rRNA (guanine(527)-N(7))-methyltransferase RsmG [bacterium]